MNIDLKGKRAIITGASRGLGKVIAERFMAAGAELWLPGRGRYDLRDEAAPYEIVSSVKGIWPSVDILVNNAAIQGPVAPAINGPQIGWESTIRVNMLAPCYLTMYVAAWMRETGSHGSIVNISGGGATSPRPDHTAYATAKCGIVRFSETAAQEMAEYGIRVNCVAPGRLNCGMGGPGGDDPAAAAELVAYLASDASFPITGKLISAKWDPWTDLSRNLSKGPDMYTLRRVVP